MGYWDASTYSGTGLTWNDSSGNNQTVTFSATPTYTSSPPSFTNSTAMNVTAVCNSITTVNFNVTNAYTFECLVQFISIPLPGTLEHCNNLVSYVESQAEGIIKFNQPYFARTSCFINESKSNQRW